MKKKIYWKDIWLTIRQSKGRFFSIFSLMMIGSMALVGLKVTTPNMERTAQLFVDKTQMLDLAVMADYGLDEADVQELKDLPQAQVEFAYLTDVTIKDSYQAVRIFSQTDKISQYELVSGHLPKRNRKLPWLPACKRITRSAIPFLSLWVRTARSRRRPLPSQVLSIPLRSGTRPVSAKPPSEQES